MNVKKEKKWKRTLNERPKIKQQNWRQQGWEERLLWSQKSFWKVEKKYKTLNKQRKTIGIDNGWTAIRMRYWHSTGREFGVGVLLWQFVLERNSMLHFPVDQQKMRSNMTIKWIFFRNFFKNSDKIYKPTTWISRTKTVNVKNATQIACGRSEDNPKHFP